MAVPLLLRARRLWHRRAAGPALRALWSAPLPARGALCGELPWLAVDLETTGLDARCDSIISIGWVAIDGGAVRLDSARRHLLRSANGVGQSAAIHGIRDAELAGAEPLEVALAALLAAARGRVLVFHHAALDLAFLDRACRAQHGAPLLCPAVDTLQLEWRRLHRPGKPLERGALRLHACRRRYGLPDYPAHDALTDALATAELLLAWIAQSGKPTLGDCL